MYVQLSLWLCAHVYAFRFWWRCERLGICHIHLTEYFGGQFMNSPVCVECVDEQRKARDLEIEQMRKDRNRV